MAWLAGNLCSGALSFIPVVGWIVGGLADIRDTIAAIIHSDWVGAGLSILGVVRTSATRWPSRPRPPSSR
jgi:hypothetical protein